MQASQRDVGVYVGEGGRARAFCVRSWKFDNASTSEWRKYAVRIGKRRKVNFDHRPLLVLDIAAPRVGPSPRRAGAKGKGEQPRRPAEPSCNLPTLGSLVAH